MANAGMLNRGNLHLIELAVRGLPTDDAVVEIGPFCGLSTNAIRRALDRHRRPNPLWCCDPWHYPIIEGVMDPAGYGDYVKETFEHATRTFSGHDLPRAVQVPSKGFFERWERGEKVTDVYGREFRSRGPIAFAYIDGEHDRENVRRDLALCDRHLVPSGYVLFDDSSAASSHREVHAFVRALLNDPGWRLTAQNPNYLVQKQAGRM